MIIMGKLTSLSKAVKKHPERWYWTTDMSRSIYGKIPYGAYQDKSGKWVPSSWRAHHCGNPFSYIMFVRATLDSIGIKTDHPRNKRGCY